MSRTKGGSDCVVMTHHACDAGIEYSLWSNEPCNIYVVYYIVKMAQHICWSKRAHHTRIGVGETAAKRFCFGKSVGVYLRARDACHQIKSTSMALLLYRTGLSTRGCHNWAEVMAALRSPELSHTLNTIRLMKQSDSP